MIKLLDKKDCCGCSSCVQICPKGCITMQEDAEGFLYPEVNESLCVGCGLCEKVCPIINTGEIQRPLNVYAARSRDERIREESSSGGVFTMLAEHVLDEGGVVFGARFNDEWEVVHDYTETKDGLRAFRGSKYVQSIIGDTFQKAECFLKSGRKVLYSGTPCQIKALKLYLRKEYSNLLSVDFVCHGVPSPGVWRGYLKEIVSRPDRREGFRKNTVLSSVKVMPVITGISFRDKTTGWKKYSFVIRGKSAGKADKNSVLLSDIHSDNMYMRAFLSDLILRPSCYACRAKKGRSKSDITIADFWGIQNIRPDLDDDKGLNLILTNSSKGIDMMRSEFLDVYKVDSDAVQKYNKGFNETVRIPINRKKFFASFSTVKSVSKLINNALRIPAWYRLYRHYKH